MPPNSWLPPGGRNLFQEVKAMRSEAAAQGIRILNLAIGQPQGPALLSARQGVAEAVMSDNELVHAYQDNGEDGVPGFAQQFVEFHTGSLEGRNVEFLPIPGIKSMLGIIPLACGAAEDNVVVYAMTDPGYPTPEVQCRYLRADHTALHLCPENEFCFDTHDIKHGQGTKRRLVMMNWPHNPSGQMATADWLRDKCEYCERNGIRLFNDAAYAALPYDDQIVTLTGIATGFPGLSWCEAFSASKLIRNGTGWRVGAMVGSPDIIEDIKTIKGNTDSGIPAFVAAGVLNAIQTDRAGIFSSREDYARRAHLLIGSLTERGMRLAVLPKAGFFTFWRLPKRAFGQAINNSEEFNRLLIRRTGVTGVHFHPYMRYAVVGDVEGMIGDISNAFEQANVSYND